MNKKGVTMISLIFYVLSFFVVVGVIGTIGIFVTKNIDVINVETDPNYAKNQLDRYLRKYINRKDSYKILKDTDTDSDYIVFTKLGVNNEVNTIKYVPESTLVSKGYIFLETRKNGVLDKKLLVSENVVGLNIYETEFLLGESLEVELKILKGEEIVSSVLIYGIER